jgi:pyruvate dehydrogenase E2 component (dihydrolipoamide acetyltransferase)
LALKNITTPDFGGAANVTVIEVLVKPGDQITAETSIITLESDKATMEIPAGDNGVVKEIKVKAGDHVATGDVLLVVSSDAKNTETKQETTKNSDKPITPDAATHESQVSDTPKHEERPIIEEVDDEEGDEPQVLTGTLQTDAEIHAGPGVRRLAREFGVNLNQITGSGPKQRILKQDVQTFVKTQLGQVQNQALAPMQMPAMPAIDFTKFGATESQALSRIKKISGKVLQRNWMMIPHVTQFAEADITSLEAFRIEQKKELEKQQIKLTPIVFIMKAVVASLKAFPNFNASIDATGENLILKKYYHIGVAVDTPDGLVVPVIRDVDQKGLIELAKELTIVSEKARKKQLLPADMQGGCFSVSSLGGIGGTAFTPIINAPEVAILGVSKSSYKPVYTDGEFVPRLMLPLSLSYDHRVVDGADGARFIMHLTNMLSDIRNLLM